jgi:hypothetical protein
MFWSSCKGSVKLTRSSAWTTAFSCISTQSALRHRRTGEDPRTGTGGQRLWRLAREDALADHQGSPVQSARRRA